MSEKARQQVKLIKNLPTLPGVLEKISRMVESNQYSADDIGKVIAQDQVLSAKVLKLANSAFYGFSRTISSVTQALVFLGFNVIKGLVLTTSVFDMLEVKSDELWSHSLSVATACGVIAAKVEFEDPEEANVAGLLHDLGKVVMSVQMQKELEEVLDLVSNGKFNLEAEKQVMGFTHLEVGSWLAESWKLPENLTESIKYHHQPSSARNHKELAAIVHLADTIVRARGFGFSTDIWVHPLDPKTLDLLNLTINDLDVLVPEIQMAVDAALSAAEVSDNGA